MKYVAVTKGFGKVFGFEALLVIRLRFLIILFNLHVPIVLLALSFSIDIEKLKVIGITDFGAYNSYA